MLKRRCGFKERSTFQGSGKVSGMYRALTRDIEVVVEPFYLEEQSDPDDDRYVWGYRIVISNHSKEAVKLVTRYWHITDMNGIVDEVTGPGVVGEQPHLKPGDTYEYSSGCPLDTPSGMMFGHYQMETDGGEQFHVKIPAFSLDTPNLLRTLN
ncbi:ApaG protein [Rhizobium tropici]|jgi:ApaG protein|uniref:Protein ApaG n=3 Tax=Rhizobium TaxID=379 RepID=A0ABR6QSK2_RHITR|nr:ApaG protein [Rhizobium sp. BK098]MBB3567929.1 ApaG protein [Rhizobium sp. BK491]MBB3616650.1 ApaG protein [Rhizobium sp. BK609]MBB3682309.1 ApaG protein [Rhizobium sp. BK612]MBB4239612.1 ApaG protein [Rhizobium tropici]